MTPKRYPVLIACVLILGASAQAALSQIFVTAGLDKFGLLAFFAYPIVLLSALILGIIRWREYSWQAFLPALLLVAGLGLVAGADALGTALRKVWFRKQIPQLETLIHTHVPSTTPGAAVLSNAQLPSAARAACHRFLAQRDSSGRVSGTCVVSRRLAYVYDPDGKLPADKRPFAPAWYEVSR